MLLDPANPPPCCGSANRKDRVTRPTEAHVSSACVRSREPQLSIIKSAECPS